MLILDSCIIIAVGALLFMWNMLNASCWKWSWCKFCVIDETPLDWSHIYFQWVFFSFCQIEPTQTSKISIFTNICPMNESSKRSMPQLHINNFNCACILVHKCKCKWNHKHQMESVALLWMTNAKWPNRTKNTMEFDQKKKIICINEIANTEHLFPHWL